MLERVLIAPERLDLGSLGEAIVYYGHTEIALKAGHLADLVSLVGIDGTINLAKSDLITFLYNDNTLGLRTDEDLLHPHSFVAFHLHATKDGRRIRGPADELNAAFSNRFGPGTISMRDTRRLADALVVRKTLTNSLVSGAITDIQDQEFLTEAVREILRARVPSYPDIGSIKVGTTISGEHFYARSNIDFRLANNLYKNHEPGESDTIKLPYLMLTLLESRSEMLYGGDRLCDIWTGEANAAFLRTKVNSFIRRLEGGQKNIDRFQEFAFPGRSFSDAIRSGERSIIDVLKFAEDKETRSFKEWMKDRPANADLLAEYEKSKIRESKFASSIPVKIGKFFAFSAAGTLIEQSLGGTGMLGALLGGAVSDGVLSIADKTLLSHLEIGWKPNQWITNKAGPFLRG